MRAASVSPSPHPAPDGEARRVEPDGQGIRFVGSHLFTGEDRRALEEIASPPRLLRAQAKVIEEGGRVDTVHLIVEGWACRYKTTRDGTRQIVGLAVPGDVANLGSLVPQRVNVGLTTPTTTLALGLPRHRLQVLMAQRPVVARALTWLAIRENAILGEWALSLGRHSARERLARFMCEMAVRLDAVHGNEARFDLPLTQEEVADVLGLTGVHVNRTFKLLRQDGLLLNKGRRIAVADMGALRAAGDFDGAYLRPFHD